MVNFGKPNNMIISVKVHKSNTLNGLSSYIFFIYLR